jgi:glycosyltransferase involved in cell wall biosynthesis
MADFLNLEALIKEAGLVLPSEFTPAVATTEPFRVPEKKVRFMLVGTHAHQTTGYSKVTYHLIQELAKYPWLELFHFGFQKFMVAPANYRVYPAGVDVYDPAAAEKATSATAAAVPQEMGFGFSQLPDYVKKVKPDVIMIYNDAGVICRFLDNLESKLTPQERTYKTLIYLDQVYIIQRPELLARMDKAADAYFAFTAYWKERMEAQGIKKPIYILRHGFDPEQFKPMDRASLRKKHGIPENLFIFLNLNRNTPRKRYDIVVSAFAELVARHPTKPLALMCVCDGGEQGWFPIQEIYLRELEKRKVPIQFHGHKVMLTKSALTYPDEIINEFYAMSDVGITAADGEGFGLCQFEAMGIGIPQVVPYIGGFRDFCKDGVNSRAVNHVHSAYLPLSASNVGGMIEVVDPKDLARAAEDYLLDSDMRESHGKAARETVCAYKWSSEVAELARVLKSFSA